MFLSYIYIINRNKAVFNMSLLYQSIKINKKKLVENLPCGSYLKNSVLNLKANEFQCYISKIYKYKPKYSIITIIYDLKDEEIFFKNLNSITNQSLNNLELIIISNGAKFNLLKKINTFLENRFNISIIINPIPEFDFKEVRLFDPVFGLANLGLLVAKGELFTWLSWDDEINSCFCEEIYKTYKETNCSCLAPIPKAIDINSKIIESNSYILEKSFDNLPRVIDSKEIIKSKIGDTKSRIFLSPGELLAYKRSFLISRQGIDFDIDLSQYLRVAAGEKVAIVRKANLFWRYHENQAHNLILFDFSEINRIKEIFHATNLYQFYKNLYGVSWAEKIRKYYEYKKVIVLLSNNIFNNFQNKEFNKKDFLIEMISEVGMKISILVLGSLFKRYFKKILYLILYVIKKPQKIFKISKFLK